MPLLYRMDYRKLERLPEDLYSLFMPKTFDAFVLFKINLNLWLKRAPVRENVIYLRKRHNLSFKPNMSLRRCMIDIRIQELRHKNGYKDPDNLNDEKYGGKDE